MYDYVLKITLCSYPSEGLPNQLFVGCTLKSDEKCAVLGGIFHSRTDLNTVMSASLEVLTSKTKRHS